MEKLISVDIKADMGFLKRPDINEGIYLTFNMLHKPALLGILGAVVGLKGYCQEGRLPQYYLDLKSLPVGIQPLNSQKGNYLKTTIQYNNSVGYASQEEGGNLIITEQVLLKPVFRCYLKLQDDNTLHHRIGEYLRNQQAEYLPYFGKNEFSLWWENYQEYEFHLPSPDREFTMATIFTTGKNLGSMLVMDNSNPFADDEFKDEFIYIERLPVSFHEKLLQYEYERFFYTNYRLRQGAAIDNAFQLGDADATVQLF